MARAEVTGRKIGNADKATKPGRRNTRGLTRAGKVRAAPTAVYSIPSFCQAHGISEALYHKLKNQGLGPDEMKLGARTLITFEAAARWRAVREAATAAATERAFETA